ncbi:MAG: hypothetical protein E7555_10135 [Ruminococcaceae bacterium]|nr:hypothetical protein [Oscillospiraceae bacterium]
MWHKISNEKELQDFMNEMWSFHDSCIKEMKYVSGAYVDGDLSMQAVNTKRCLSVIIQRQAKENTTIEMVFEKLKFLKLFPCDEKYTCEIFGATMFFKDGYVYWCDDDDVTDADIDTFEGTIICASALSWRSVENRIGNDEFYVGN